MLKNIVGKTVDFCSRYPWLLILISIALTVISGVYVSRHFAISTDIGKLISADLPWRQREIQFEKLFPDRYETILAVVDAPTSERASQASNLLMAKLQEEPTLFKSVRQPGGADFFMKNGLLFLPTEEVEKTTKNLDDAEPLVTVLTSDPSVRGLTDALSLGLAGVQRGDLTLDAMATTLNMAAEPIEKILAGQKASFSWRALASGKPATPSELRRFIEVWAHLDFTALEPGGAASTAIRKAAADLKLQEKFDARVRLTGPVPIADEEFATVKEGAVANAIGTIAVVLLILWMALRSGKIILAVFLNLVVGLSITAAVGFLLVGSLNLISIAFAVLFIGIGVDFGIQYSVRYRAERHEIDDVHEALVRAGREVGAPLTLAAAATTAGFLSFMPTAYRGLGELGEIAGSGMIIAFITSVTLLPALLKVLNPPGEKEPLGYKSLAPVDRFLERQRMPVLIGTGLIVLAGLPALYFLEFDFNPINLRSAKVESVATFLELRQDPNTGASSVDVLAPSLDAAVATGERLSKLPEVARVMTLKSFVPDDQDKKLGFIKPVAESMGAILSTEPDAPPTDAQNVAALTKSADQLTKLAAGKEGPGATAAKRLAAAETKLAQADFAMRERTAEAFLPPLRVALGELKNTLSVEQIALENLPEDITKSWLIPDGRSRVEALPTGDPNDNETLRKFARSVLSVAPEAIGGPVSILETGTMMVRAFLEAGFWALLSIAILLWIVLRRFGDVLLTLIPLLLAGVVTLEISVLIGLKLNYANIIALPLLLGVGVAFKIYYIMAWRAGLTDLLQSSLTRAVFWSSLTTATAFGSLWLSSHPGTSSMGKLLAISLVTTLAAAVLFQPVLMGKPRTAPDA
jgi:hopanoid biosynthesis associated RND transporter like protein HpnN